MLEALELNRPSFKDILGTIRLFSVAEKSKNYDSLAPEEMNKAGLFISSRERIWLYLAEENLRPIGINLTPREKSTLIDLFSILRRMYKSADDAWDQSREVRGFITRDPFSCATSRLVWQAEDDSEKVTHLSPLFDYLNLRLSVYFPSDEEKRLRIIKSYTAFVKESVVALIALGRLQALRQPSWQANLDFYLRTTGAIGKTIGTVLNEIINGDDCLKQTFQVNFRQAAIVSQLGDDIRDLPIDLRDEQSPSVVKGLLYGYPVEWQAFLNSTQANRQHISYRIFSQLVPQTALATEHLFLEFIKNLPENLQQFLKDFYYCLPPLAVSHTDASNKTWHTSPVADKIISEYTNRRPEDAPYKLVDFLDLEIGQTKPGLAILIDPGKQSMEVVLKRVKNFISMGGQIILIGGSDINESASFQETVDGITAVTGEFSDVSIIIFPGDITQIPKNNCRIKGILNYKYILGSLAGKDFETVFPAKARLRVENTLRKRQIKSISTLYVLCGDPKASVSQVTGISPIDLHLADQKIYLLAKVEEWLKKGIACIYLEGGSGASYPVPSTIVYETRRLIEKYSPRTLLFVGGGLTSPEDLTRLKDTSSCMVIGTHFEATDAKDTDKFIAVLND